MKNELTIEESKALIDLGVDPKLASKKKFVDIHPEVLKGNAEYAKPWGFFPIFTLTDILSILPKEIDGYYLAIEMANDMSGVAYKKGRDDFMMGRFFYAPELIDALTMLLKWVLNREKTEKNKEKS